MHNPYGTWNWSSYRSSFGFTDTPAASRCHRLLLQLPLLASTVTTARLGSHFTINISYITNLLAEHGVISPTTITAATATTTATTTTNLLLITAIAAAAVTPTTLLLLFYKLVMLNPGHCVTTEIRNSLSYNDRNMDYIIYLLVLELGVSREIEAERGQSNISTF